MDGLITKHVYTWFIKPSFKEVKSEKILGKNYIVKMLFVLKLPH